MSGDNQNAKDPEENKPAEDQKELTVEDMVRAALEPVENDPDVKKADGTADEKPAEEKPADKVAEDKKPAEDQKAAGGDENDGVNLLAVPENWDQSRKDAFGTLGSEEAKQTYLDTVKSLERGFQTKFDDLATVRKEHEVITGLMQPFETQLQTAGLDRVGGIRMLVGAQQLLTQNPVQGLTQLLQQFGGSNAKVIIQEIAKQYGIGVAADDSQAYQDPEIATLRGQVDSLGQTIQQNTNQAQQQRMADAQQQITLFEKAQDNDGNVLHPHFGKVKLTMSTLITSGLAPSMEAAYSQAVSLDKDLSAENIKAAEDKVAETLNNARQKDVAESKRASKNVKTNHKAPDNEPPEPDSVIDSVRKTFEAQG